MAVKKQPILTKEDFEVAVATLRLSVSEVARETGIPRNIVSHFRNYGDGMKPEQVAKLRDWLESKGIEFTDQEDKPAAPQTGNSKQPITLPRILADDGLTQRTALVCRHFFVDERLTDDQITEAGERVKENFNKAKELLGVELSRAMFSGNFDEATDTKLRELWGYLARVGLVCLHIQGRILIDQDRVQAGLLSEDERPEPKTFGDLLTDLYREAVAGLNADDQAEQAEAEKEEVTA